jgi:hypothetical protein
MTDPTRPTLFDTVAGPEHKDLALEERLGGQQYIYTAGPQGMEVYQILVDGRSLALGSFPTGDRGYAVALSRPGTAQVWAAVADHARGVHLIRLEHMGGADFTGSGFRVPTTYAYDAAVANLPGRGWHLLVADAEGGLKLFDLRYLAGSDPASRVRAVGTGFSADARAVVALGPDSPYVVVADGREGLRVFDLSPPETIRQVAVVPKAGLLDVAVARRGTAAVAVLAAADGLTVVDLATPQSPAVRGRLTTGQGGVAATSARKVAVLDPAVPLFAAITATGLVVLDASNPQAPRAVGVYPTEFGEDLYVPEGGGPSRRVYVAEGHLGMTVLDLTEPLLPRRISSFPDVYVVGVTGWEESPDHLYAYAVDTARVWQVQILVPAWLRR